MVMKDTDNELVERTCYVCGVDLTRKYKNDTAQQNNFNASTQKFPEMILWNGKKEEVCSECYKAYVEGLEVYKENNPNFELHQPREF